MGDRVRTPFSRVWTIEDRAGPANVPIYQGQAKVMSPSADFGDLTAVRNPDPNRYGAFKVVESIRGEPGLPTLPLQVRYQYTLSEFLRMGNRGCPLDVQVHMGKCQDARDQNRGWDKILVLEAGRITGWNPDEMGALEQGEDAIVNEGIDITGLTIYEIITMALAELGAAEVNGQVIDVVICDSIQCGACGIPSSGCDTFFAITETQVGSPGLPAELIYSQDGGTTLGETNITTLATNEDPSAMACVGTRLAVVSNDDCGIHYATISEILLGTETWVRTATGLVCPNGEPNAIFSLGSAQTWIVGDGGYIYFSSDITAGVTVQDAGVATTEVLNAIRGYDEDNLVAVGENNAVVLTRNGGGLWTSVTGPNVGVILNTIWMRTKDEWFIGDAGGQLWYTRNGGDTWTEKTFPGSGAGVVRDIVFATDTVGYLAHSIAGPAGRILRTIDGGQSWYVLPEGTGAIPANDYVAALAAVSECPNTVYGGGLAEDATDGFLVKGNS